MKTFLLALFFTGAAFAQTNSIHLLQTNLPLKCIEEYREIVENRNLWETKKTVEKLEALTSKQENFYKARYLLGVTYLAEGDFEKASKALHQALTIKTNLNIKDATIYNSSGWALFLGGNRKEGEKLLHEALDSQEPSDDPDLHIKILNNLGVVFMQKGDYKAGREYFNQAAKIDKSKFTEENLRTVEALEHVQKKPDLPR